MDASLLCSKFARLLTALSAGVLLASCSMDSGVSASSPSTGGGDVTSTITLTKFQNSTTAFGVNVTADETLPTVSQDFQFDGTCSRGVKSVKVYIKPPSGSFTDSGVLGACSADQLFTWSKGAIGADGEYVAKLVPVNGLGVESSATIQKTILIDTTAPIVPNTITVNTFAAADGSTKLVTTPNPEVAGSIANDTKTLVMNSPGNFYVGTSCSGTPVCASAPTCEAFLGETSFCYMPTLAEGESRLLSIASRDKYGNTSNVFQVTVAYIPPLASDPNHIQFATITMMPQTSGGTTLVRASNEGFDGDSAVSVGGVSFALRAGRVPYLVGLE